MIVHAGGVREHARDRAGHQYRKPGPGRGIISPALPAAGTLCRYLNDFIPALSTIILYRGIIR